MPIYEYICLDCGTRFDALRSMKDADAPIDCRDCHSAHTSRQLIVKFASHAKGNGGGRTASGGGGGCAGCSAGSCAGCGR